MSVPHRTFGDIVNLALAAPAHAFPTGAEAPAAPLEGRVSELSALIDRIPRNGAGPASAVLVTASAGMGRSALLRAFCGTAASRASVLRTGPLDGTWYASGGAERSGARLPPHDGSLSAFRLHRAVSDLARHGPVVLAVDDAHLCRPHTLHGVGHVLRRSAGLPLLAVVTMPTVAAVEEPPAVTALLAQHAWTTVELAPLAARDVARVLARRLGGLPEPALLHRCLEYSRGVPAAVHAFADRHGATDADLRGDMCSATGREPEPAHGRRAGPDSLPRSASAVLSAVAALGSAEPELVSELIQLPLPTVRRVLDRLAELRALPPEGSGEGSGDAARPLPHGVPADDLVPLRPRAARLLEDRGRPPAEVAEVLLRIGHGAQPWMLETLYSAALDTGSDARAMRYLSHALDIGAGQDARVVRRIRARLAEILSTTAPDLALPHLSALLMTSDDGHEAAGIASRYADTLIGLGRGEEAARLLARVLDHPAGSTTTPVAERHRPELEAALLLSGTLGRDTLRWVRERSQTATAPTDDAPGHHRLQLARAALAVLGGRPANVLTEDCARAAATPPGTPLADLTLTASALVAHFTDDDTGALDALDRILCRPAPQGPGPVRAKALMVRALVLSGTGDLPAAEDDSRQALENERFGELAAGPVTTSAQAPGPRPEATAPAVLFAYVLAQRGRVAAAESMLSQVGRADLEPLFYVHPLYWWARAAIRRARGDAHGALVALRAGGRCLPPGGAASPVVLPWWLEAADILTELGRPDEARHIAAQGGMSADRWGTPRGAGLALLARGLATPGRAGHRLLDDACAQLAESRARPLWARAEYALGSALLDAGDPRGARTRLRTALDLMTGCGAGNAAEGIRLRLARAGGRPRRLTGRPGDALTERERRVAALAMAGRSNREIAGSLYITRRTVELHLTNAYQKLGVSGREELGGVLRASHTKLTSRPGGEER
ncbi:helix-turn-helix transcriptional regulator [Streptomyces graminilatus]|uniref:helix-turn-helix transcriptional regulator n=1 Tax=Streptomyces graminilatus TaxID=1464070 RepID=UPI0006E152DC|nr:LuxR family transcriptional regulator [Streptomyces graminilatus]